MSRSSRSAKWARSAQPVAVRSSIFPVLFATAFVLFVLAMLFAGQLPGIVPAVYLVASIVTFFTYAFDKSAASRNAWRISENSLHLLALVGGWPGGLAAQRLLRHKSAKKSFLISFWFTVVLNCGLLGWVLSPAGARVLYSVLDSI
jgi:uncharacterized membrane protein YsdA (DUF1294 family)